MSVVREMLAEGKRIAELGRPNEAFDYLESRREELARSGDLQFYAATGDAAAQFVLADYLEEKFLLLSENESQGVTGAAMGARIFTLYSLSAEQGYDFAFAGLARCYACGIGVEPNDEEYVRYLEMAVDRGDKIALYNLANYHYDEGEIKKAFPLLLDAAKLGHPICYLRVGHCYFDGQGVEADIFKAIDAYISAGGFDNNLSAHATAETDCRAEARDSLIEIATMAKNGAFVPEVARAIMAKLFPQKEEPNKVVAFRPKPRPPEPDELKAT